MPTVTFNEIGRFKINPYHDRVAIIEALNNCGYGTRVEIVNQTMLSSGDHFVIVFEIGEKDAK